MKIALNSVSHCLQAYCVLLIVTYPRLYVIICRLYLVNLSYNYLVKKT